MIQAFGEIYRYLTGFHVCSILFRVFLAVLLGSIIGLERKHHGRAAGVKTHTLVCLGASLTVMVGLYANYGLGLSGDPLRVGAQVISGIGFLGAGTIMTRHHSQVTGLTTAAGLWTTATLGLAIGLGFYSGALLGFLAMKITIHFFSRQDQLIHSYRFYLELDDASKINSFTQSFAGQDVSFDVLSAKSGTHSNIGVYLTISSSESQEALLQTLRGLPHVVFALLSK